MRLALVWASVSLLSLTSRGQSDVATSTAAYQGASTAPVPGSYTSLFAQPTYFGAPAPGGRASMAGWRAFDQQRTKSISKGVADLGPIAFTINTSAVVLYNSNLNQSPNSPVASLGINPAINLGLHWVITRRNELDLSLGASLTYYLTAPGYNGNTLQVAPGTVIKYSVFIGDFVFTLYDSPSITSSPSQAQGVTNVVNFSQLGNQAGLLVLWDLNKLTLNAGLELQSTLSLNNQFNSQNSNQITVYGGGSYQLTPTLSLGVKGLVAGTTYSQDVLNNYTLYQGGLVIQDQMSRYTVLYAEFGLQLYEFSDNGVQSESGPVFVQSGGHVTNIAATGGGGDSLGPYFNIGISNRLNRYYSHTLSLTYSTGASGISNSSTQSAVSYSGNWRMNHYVNLNGILAAQQTKFSGASTGASTQLSASLGFSYFLNRKLPVTFRYTLTDQVGSQSVTGYMQSIFSVGVAYNF